MTLNRSTIVIILPSIHHVLRVEKLLEKAGFPFDLIPVPKEVNPDCGMAVEIPPSRFREVAAVLAERNIRVEAVYRRDGRDFTPLEDPSRFDNCPRLC